jgi:hypothetical protein
MFTIRLAPTSSAHSTATRGLSQGRSGIISKRRGKLLIPSLNCLLLPKN